MKSKEVEPVNSFWCETCGAQTEMSHPEAMDHLRTVHGLDTKGLKGKKSMQMHMDGDTWFSYVWMWTIETPDGELKLRNETISPRAKNDPMRYSR